MKTILAAALTAVLTLVIASAPLASMADADNEDATADSNEDRSSASALADAVRFRSTVGFQSDAEHVGAAAADTEQYADMQFGVPLSNDEAAELTRRVTLQESLGPAIDWVASQANFAGLYLDQLDAGTPVFLFVDPDPSIVDELRSHLPDGTVYRVESRVWTLAYLQDVMADIQHDIEADVLSGAGIVSVAVDQTGNRLLIGMTNADAASEESLQAQYGQAVAVRQESAAVSDSCTGVGACWPPKGGIRVRSTANNQYCTSAFLAKRPATGKKVVVTAGHCIKFNGGSDTNWKHSGTEFGVAKQWVWGTYKNADVGVIEIFDSVASGMTTFKLYLEDVSPVSQVDLSQTVSHTYQLEGWIVCRMGGTWLLDCGTIYDVGVMHLSCVGTDCRWVMLTNEVDFDSTAGDSGGSMFAPVANNGYGLHVHSEADAPGAHGWYSPLDLARSTLISETGVTIEWCTDNYSC